MLVKKIEQYISDLLFEHDCVIIPSFGGFVARNASAHFAKTGHMLLPPSKSIVFNKNLSNNDGLLAGHIMLQEQLNYQQANQVIEQFVQHCKKQLAAHKRFEISNLGVLYTSRENTILFEQDYRINYNIQGFGLPPVSALKLIQPLLEPEKKPNLQYRTIKPIADKADKNGKTFQRIAIAASLAFCIITLLFVATKQNPWNDVQASLNPFLPNNPKILVGEQKNKASLPEADAVKAEPVVIKPTVVPDTVHADKTAVVKPAETIAAWYEQPYQVVVGCFAVKQNAFKLINQLEKQNLQASIAGQNAKNLFVVSVAGYLDEKQARKKLAEIKAQYPAAWLFKR